MELKLELIKAILEYVLKNADGKCHLKSPSAKDLNIAQALSDSDIAYHVQLCVEANYINARTGSHQKVALLPNYEIGYLTLLGHRQLDSAGGIVVWDMLDR